MRIMTVAAAIILTANAFAQNISVSQVSVIPASPTTTDTIRIATITGTPYLGESYGLSFSLSEDTVHITGCFLDGAAQQPTVYYDTVTIGTLPPGTYHVLYEARVSDTGECDSFSGNDWGQADFQVDVLSIGEQDGNWGIHLFPNPSADLQSLSLWGTEKENLQIDLYDMQGRLMRNVYDGFTPSGEKTVSTNVADLSPAMYLYRIRYGGNTKTLRFVKQ